MSNEKHRHDAFRVRTLEIALAASESAAPREASAALAIDSALDVICRGKKRSEIKNIQVSKVFENGFDAERELTSPTTDVAPATTAEVTLAALDVISLRTEDAVDPASPVKEVMPAPMSLVMLPTKDVASLSAGITLSEPTPIH